MKYIKGCDAQHPFRLEGVILMQDIAGLAMVTGETGEPKCNPWPSPPHEAEFPQLQLVLSLEIVTKQF